MVEIRVHKGEPLQDALDRFQRKVREEGIFDDTARRLHHLNSGELSKFKARR